MKGSYTGAIAQVGNSAPPVNISVQGHLGEFALGYFSANGKNETFSFLGGYGSGSINNNWTSRGTSSADFNKLFVQTTLGKRSKYFELIIGIKLANLNYHNLNQSFQTQTFIDEFDVIKSPMPIVESGGMLRLGLKHVKLQFQAMIMQPLKLSVPEFPAERLALGIGICAQLNGNKAMTKK